LLRIQGVSIPTDRSAAVIRSFARWTSFAAVMLAACSSSEPNPGGIVDCSNASPTVLAPGEFTTIDAAQTACVRIPAAGAQESEYLYVALATAGTETQNGISAPYQLTGGLSAVASAAAHRSPVFDRALTAAQRFHDVLRQRERALSERPGAGSAARSRISASVVVVPPAVNSKRTFDVCATTSCDSFVSSTATAKLVGQRVAIYVDDETPNAYGQAALDSVGALFDSHLYPIDTTAFGRESDLDNNGVVIVLLTPEVNRLSPNCNAAGSVILGFFFGLDLLPRQAHSNAGEVFYGVVPGTITPGCSIPESEAVHSLPPVFIHEFQHMISFNQHVLVRGGTSEDTWLNEGLSHFAEELGGEQVPDAFCVPAFPNCESQFNGGNLDNAFSYLVQPDTSYLIEPGSSSGTLSERGANWLMVRWLGDHFATTEPQATELTRALLQTSRVGAANVQAVTGEDFSVLVSQWQLANYLTNLPGFTPASNRLQYTTLNLRAIYQANFQSGIFSKPYPLTPDSTRDGTYNHSGTLLAGSGHHLRIIQESGSTEASFDLTNPAGSLPVSSAVKPRIAIARVR
jgi:hypothetical protein